MFQVVCVRACAPPLATSNTHTHARPPRQSPDEVVLPIRVARYLGCRAALITNAAGGLNPAFAAGDLMLLEDHINMIGANPLRGPNPPEREPPFGPLFRCFLHSPLPPNEPPQPRPHPIQLKPNLSLNTHPHTHSPPPTTPPPHDQPPVGGPRFLDLSAPYDAAFNAVLRDCASELGLPPLREGVYVGVSGPTYETRAEVRFFRVSASEGGGGEGVRG